MDKTGRSSPMTRPTVSNTLGILALMIPVVAYFWFIDRYALNVLYYDSWSDVFLIGHPFTLLNQHNENRIVFPNIVVLVLAATTHFSTLVETYLSGVMLVVSASLIIWTHHRRSPSTPWLYYLPVVVIMFSLVQAGNTLWGFQMAWYLVVLSLAAALFFLDRPTVTELSMAVMTVAAMAAAFVGSFSSLMGLFIWPIGLIVIWYRKRPKGVVVAWIAAGALTTLFYFAGFNFGETYSDTPYLLRHPIEGIKTFFFVMGDMFGAQSYDNVGIHPPSAPNLNSGLIIAIGVVVFAVSAGVVAIYGFRRDRTGGSPVGVALVCFGFLYVLNIAIGRTSPAPLAPSAGASRYATFTLLILAGTYLTLLSRPKPGITTEQLNLVDPNGQQSRTRPPLEDAGNSAWNLAIYRVVQATVIGLVGLLIVLGTIDGIAYGRYWHQREVQMADVTVNLSKASDAQVDNILFPQGASRVREWSHIATERHLSLFNTGAVGYFTRVGLFKGLTAGPK